VFGEAIQRVVVQQLVMLPIQRQKIFAPSPGSDAALSRCRLSKASLFQYARFAVFAVLSYWEKASAVLATGWEELFLFTRSDRASAIPYCLHVALDYQSLHSPRLKVEERYYGFEQQHPFMLAPVNWILHAGMATRGISERDRHVCRDSRSDIDGYGSPRLDSRI
jgi:hypothetical protein